MLVAGAMVVGTPATSRAADAQGMFAVKGAGFETCSRFVEIRNARDSGYLAFRSWLNGYLTAYNQFATKTYDIAGGVDLERLAAQIAVFCDRHPNEPFVTAATAMTQAYRERRTQVSSASTAAASPAPATPARQAPVKPIDIQKALKKNGYYQGPVDGMIGPGTRTAIRAFQKDNGLPANGKLDPATVSKLF